MPARDIRCLRGQTLGWAELTTTPWMTVAPTVGDFHVVDPKKRHAANLPFGHAQLHPRSISTTRLGLRQTPATGDDPSNLLSARYAAHSRQPRPRSNEPPRDEATFHGAHLVKTRAGVRNSSNLDTFRTYCESQHRRCAMSASRRHGSRPRLLGVF
jgi:hypothetical protein